ncbi:MAG: helix-turn-helix transcriptional regulator, partial [Oscillospiraceae bacterium]|nr:helix-turn-helix transcriptional regulator [Oscillospiraceae bacterium]
MLLLLLGLAAGVVLGLIFRFAAVRLIGAVRARKSREDGAVEDGQLHQSLAEILKARRTSRGMTQEQVAEAVGVSRQAVSKWENGTAEPSTSNLLA